MAIQELADTCLLPPMSYEKAIEIISDLERGLYTSKDPDVKTALRMAKVALITEKLNF
jgi:hypothetical protein